MRPTNLFWIELLEDTRHRRSLALKFALPLILTLPFALPQFTSDMRYSGLALLALFLGVLGSSVGLSRLRERGILERLSLLPARFRILVRDFLFANIVMDMLQMAGPVAILAIAFHVRADFLALAGFALVLSIVLANTIGVLVAMASGGSGEVHLYSALSVLLIAGLSGVFTGTSTGVMGAISASLPFGLLADGLSQAPGSVGVQLIVSSVVTVALTTFTIASSERLLRR